MDTLSALLDGPRAQDAFLLRSVLSAPWSLRVQDEAPLTVVAVVAGHAWVVPDGAEPSRLEAGDVAVVRGPDHYTVADDPATPPSVIIHPGQLCTTPDGIDLHQPMTIDTRTWGNDPGGPTMLLTGTYQQESDVSQRVLSVLPPLVAVRAGTWDSPLVGLLRAELVKDGPGQDAVLDRLLDLLLIAVLRVWLSRPDAGAPGWYRAQGDPVVGPALRLLHSRPAEGWTVASLASQVGASRAALARRFTELVGEPPMAFLAAWRLDLAADLLREPGRTVSQVAREVGYGSPYALSTAFKRARGTSPKQHRDQARRAG
ncbi:MAG TPA: AraC family transcriptional regulator [Acidimicrobiales bacterium]|jgi:AraC-like DNA-binding protein|nr:AraC family transcriptional regulator [Acidimicrobiales bacterium]